MRALLSLAIVIVVLSGCLGSAAGPGFPQESLATSGWTASGGPSLSEVYRMAEIRTQQYGPGGSTNFGGAMVVSVTDVPFIDESKYVPAEIERYGKQRGVTFVQTSTEAMTLGNIGDARVDARIYDVQGAPVPSKAAIIEVRCPEPKTFVVAVGFGSTASGGGLLGGSTADVYASAKGLLSSLACSV